jgi:hypothetical protein
MYWVHHKRLAEGLTSKVGLRPERDVIRRWLHTALLKGIVGTSADTILAAIRRAFTDAFANPYIKRELKSFPRQEISVMVKAQGRDPQISDDFSPNLDYKNGDFHKDHLHPASAFRRKNLLKAGLTGMTLSFTQTSQTGTRS